MGGCVKLAPSDRGKGAAGRFAAVEQKNVALHKKLIVPPKMPDIRVRRHREAQYRGQRVFGVRAAPRARSTEAWL